MILLLFLVPAAGKAHCCLLFIPHIPYKLYSSFNGIISGNNRQRLQAHMNDVMIMIKMMVLPELEFMVFFAVFREYSGLSAEKRV